jgi:hypothetical protein
MLEHVMGPRHSLENPPILFEAPLDIAAISEH